MIKIVVNFFTIISLIIIFCLFIWVMYIQMDLLSKRALLTQEVAGLEKEVEYLKTHKAEIVDQIIESIPGDEKLVQMLRDYALQAENEKLIMLGVFLATILFFYSVFSFNLFGFVGGSFLGKCNFSVTSRKVELENDMFSNWDILQEVFPNLRYYLGEKDLTSFELDSLKENILEALLELECESSYLLLMKTNELSILSETIEAAQLAGILP